jgi:hypothetical protein
MAALVLRVAGTSLAHWAVGYLTAAFGAKASLGWGAGAICDSQTRQRGDLVPKSPEIGRMSVKDAYFWNAAC